LIESITERKLNYFSDIIKQEIEGKKGIARAMADAVHSKSAAAAIEAVERRNKVMLRAKQSEFARKQNRIIAQAKVRNMADLVKIRMHLTDHLFVDISANLAGFTQTTEYEAYLIDSINKARMQSGHNFSIIVLTPHDMRISEQIKTATGLLPECGEQDLIGGFILLNELRSVMLDCSFKARLATTKQGFCTERHGTT